MSFSVNPNSIQYFETTRGVAFSADLLLDGVKVGTVEHAGQGGWAQAELNGTHDSTIRKQLEHAAHEQENGGAEVEYYLEHLMDVAKGVQTERFDLSDIIA